MNSASSLEKRKGCSRPFYEEFRMFLFTLVTFLRVPFYIVDEAADENVEKLRMRIGFNFESYFGFQKF